MSFLLKFLLLLGGVLCAALTFAAEPPQALWRRQKAVLAASAGSQ